MRQCASRHGRKCMNYLIVSAFNNILIGRRTTTVTGRHQPYWRLLVIFTQIRKVDRQWTLAVMELIQYKGIGMGNELKTYSTNKIWGLEWDDLNTYIILTIIYHSLPYWIELQLRLFIGDCCFVTRCNLFYSVCIKADIWIIIAEICVKKSEM